jgi:hypothetical protein
VSLNEELATEIAERKQAATRSEIEVFLDGLPAADREDFDTWIADGARHPGAMYAVLQRRGLSVATSTFRNWVRAQCR